MGEIYVVLFVCTGNTCRSPLAAGALRVLLQRERPHAFDVLSRGTAAVTGYPATPHAIEAARMWEADLSDHRSQPLSAELVRQADLIFGMTSNHVREVLRLGPSAVGKTYLFKNFPSSSADGEAVEDPIGQPLRRYKEMSKEIGERVGKHLPQILERIDARQDSSE